MASIDRDVPKFEKKKDNIYLSLCKSHLMSILHSYPTMSKYSIPVLCRTIIEVCVKSHFNWKLDRNMEAIVYRIENTKWKEETKELATRVYKDGCNFTHGNSKQITKSLKKYLKTTNPNIKFESKHAHALINYYIAFTIMVCIDLINEEFTLLDKPQ